MLGERSSGVLLHPTSLPRAKGNGDLGEAARAFVDFLADAGQRWWLMLPVGPPGFGDSPYSAESAFAGNPLLISLEALVDDGLLTARDLEGGPEPTDRVDYGAAWAYREERLKIAFEAHERLLQSSDEEKARFRRFCRENERWLEDYALYGALKRAHGRVAWTEWEPELRDRRPRAMRAAREKHAREIAFHRFEQYTFDRQWAQLREYAALRRIGLAGDVPIFVAHDSADVWQHRKMFRLDDRGQPTVIAGVPPDYFSATGQRWGNPLYRWKRMRRDGYSWWIARFEHTLRRFDVVRLDHFIGFSRYWEIPAAAPTAIEGRWVKGPGAHFFEAVLARLGRLPLIAEDLGAVTKKVTKLRDQFDLPGIRVLQFAFGNDPQAPTFLPHNYPRRAVVFTGTHDNDTTVGWFRDEGGTEALRSKEQADKERKTAMDYLASDGKEIHWDMIRMALMSVAATAILPAQDLLGLGSEARMNRPGVAAGNWTWRLREGALDGDVAARLLHLTRTYGRAPAAAESGSP